MRRNTLPIKSSSNRKPQTNPSIAAHLARMTAMMNAPSGRTNRPTVSKPEDKNSADMLSRMISQDDSDDYYDDYILSDNEEESGSDSEQFVSATLAKHNRDRGATQAEIRMLQKNVMVTRVQGVCSICLEEWKDKDEFLVLPCVHKFHQGCIRDWLQKRNKCPCCNSVVFEEEPE